MGKMKTESVLVCGVLALVLGFGLGVGSGAAAGSITPDENGNLKWGENNFAGKGEITAADVAEGGIYHNRGISAGIYNYKDAAAWGENQ